jgi:hypothetical protein
VATTNEPNGIVVRALGATGTGLMATGSAIAASGLLSSDTTVAGVGAVLLAVGIGVKAAYDFLHTH